MTLKKTIILLSIGLALVACGGGSTPEQDTPPTTVQLRLVMSYKPDVQFTPFYVADAHGFFDEENLEIEFNHMPESESVKLVGADEIQFAVVSGEQVLLARAQGLPVVYVLAWWQDYPIAIAAPETSGIQTPEDLVGKKVGFPGVYGASYIGYRALLSAAGVTEDEITLDAIGFTQVEALYEGLEDAVVIYANNEPLQLEAQGLPVNVIRVADYVHLASNGLITNEKTIAERPDLVRRMVSAFLSGLQDTIDDPQEAYEIATGYVEGLAQANEAVQKGVLAASIEFWKADPLGHSNPESWENMQQVLLEMGLLEVPLDLSQAFTNEFLP
jgi:NitT/TauT family transport system substrate-binding protein